MSKDESVLCFPSSRLDELQPASRFQGFTNNMDLVSPLFGKDTKFSFVPRSQCETDPTYKQVIPYSIIQYGKTRDDMLIFSYTRGKAGGEDRLKKLKSIGVGGHVNEDILSKRNCPHSFVDGRNGQSKYFDYVKQDAQREILEEIKFESKNPLFYLCGLINDDSNIVGSVHFGCVFRLLLSSPDVSPNEDAISDGEMVTVRELMNHIDEYEPWSQLILKGMRF